MSDIAIRKGQKIEMESFDGVIVEGMVLRDVSYEDNIVHVADECVMRVRIDLACSMIVDGKEMINEF